ncbi:MAG: glutamate-5-semialdehyde dehydrogenase [Nitrospirae bacterium]|nr:glutamate-5-semialdehyde dehydrogenase [Nitrospirota bacterium]
MARDFSILAREIGSKAREAAAGMARAGVSVKNRFLTAVADRLGGSQDALLQANGDDVSAARRAGTAAALVDRLTLDPRRVMGMAASLREIAALPDPVGEISGMWVRPNGLRVGRMRIPLGVVGIIYEARPNVTSDAAGLCVKSGNAVVLRGGSEALRSNRFIAELMREELRRVDLPENGIQLVGETDHAFVDELLKLEQYIDLIVPRGGEALIRSVAEKSRIPVVKHYKGVCHVYVDEFADLAMAREICLNAKVQRPAVCNAMETLLVHEEVAVPFLRDAGAALAAQGVEIRGCPRTQAILPAAKAAVEADWYEEYLGLILAVRVVDGLDEAMAHIRKYGSLHTESIVTRDYARAERFVREVESSTVVVNASTRFSDGYELGLGAEVGISTSKIHAYGPMGLQGLTTQKFVVYGNGQIRT